MKIALFHELQEGGARRGANEFAKAIRQLGHAVDLFLVDEKYNSDEKEYYDRIYHYKFSPVQWHGGNWKKKLYKDTVELYKLNALHKKISMDIKKNRYDFVFVHPSQFTQAPFILSHLKIPSLYYCQEPLRMVYESMFDKTKNLSPGKRLYERVARGVRKRIDKKNISQATVVLTNSTFTKDNIKKAYGIDAIVCYMGVDGRRFYKDSTKKDIDVLFIGSKESVDGYPLFQESLRLVKTELNIAYLLRGELWLSDDRELRRYYSRAKIVVCFGHNEPFGLIPLEAMSCGTAVLALSEGGYKDSVKNGKTGILVQKNSHMIAKEIDLAFSDPQKIYFLGKNALDEMRKNWTWRKSAEHIINQASKIKT